MASAERFTVAAEDAGLRLDQVLARRVPGLSRRRARLLIDIGGVFIDRVRVKIAGRLVTPGQVIEAHIGGALDRAAGGRPRDAGDPTGEPEDDAPPPYVVVHEDDDLIVVDKPAGLVTAPTPESDRGDLLDLLSRRPGSGRVILVHRLDLPTSGVLVFAKSDLANRELARRFAAHDIEREYRAVVAGQPAETFTVDQPIRGKRAVTHVTVLERFAGSDAALLAVRLETGRSHQIRIHLAGLGHPVLGDREHGGERARTFRPRPPRLALHAAVLGFVHPRTGQPCRFERPLPADLADWLHRLHGLGAAS